MNFTEMKWQSMVNLHQFINLSQEEDKIIVYEKGDLVYVFNFHSTNSYNDYEVGTYWKSDHFILYDSDEARFDGHKRLTEAHGIWFKPYNKKTHNRPYTMKLYIPSRCCFVMSTYDHAMRRRAEFEIPEMPVVTGGHENNELDGSQPAIV
jgi:1,4-alpha-glucan branching enzyme